MLQRIDYKLGRVFSKLQTRYYIRPQARFRTDLDFTQAVARFPDRNTLHAYMVYHFHHHCPEPIRAHRIYFTQEQRGFGEDAFHAMWWTLLREFRPHRCLEIDVYRGQVITLWALIGQLIGFDCKVNGISPF